MTYLQHRTQFDGSTYANENCAPTSAANGARVATAGRVDLTGARVRALLPRDEEENPNTPGWTLRDIDNAMAKINVPYTVSSGWQYVESAHRSGFAITMPGISNVFTAGCSGAFDGPHHLVIYPESHSDRLRWMIGDPICEKARWESIALIRRYSTAYDSRNQFGYFPVIDTRTYTQAELDAAKATAKATGVIEGTEAEQRRIARLLGLID